MGHSKGCPIRNIRYPAGVSTADYVTNGTRVLDRSQRSDHERSPSENGTGLQDLNISRGSTETPIQGETIRSELSRKRERFAARPSLEKLFAGVSEKATRNEQIYQRAVGLHINMSAKRFQDDEVLRMKV